MAAMLAGGDRRSLGHSNLVVAQVLRQPARFGELIECLWNENLLVRMRAADAAEKVTRQRPGLLAPHKAELLGLLEDIDAGEPEMRWNLVQMIPRLPLHSRERERAMARLREFFEDRSSILRTCALQSWVELASGDPAHRAEMLGLLEVSARQGTAAVRARARKLLNRLLQASRVHLAPSRPSELRENSARKAAKVPRGRKRHGAPLPESESA